MGFLERLFGAGIAGTEQSPNHSNDLAQVEAQLAHLPNDQATYLAGFALLLAHIAHADLSVSEGERRRIAEVLCKHSRLDEAQAALVADLATRLAARHSGENHIIFRKLNAVASRPQKEDILRGLLFVAADEDISTQENEEVFFVAKALGLDRKEYLAIRSEFHEHLAVLKNLPSSSR